MSPLSGPQIEIRRHSPERPWRYADLHRRQQAVRRELLADPARPGALLLSEVAPVITLGRRARTETELTAPAAAYAARGIEILTTERGGLATYHGPGQWVLFVVDRLDRLTGDPRGVRRAVDGLLRVALTACRTLEPRAELRAGPETGVWGPRGKLASVGVQIEDGVLQHGLCVNGHSTTESFYGLRPCGLDAAPVQFLLDSRPPGDAFTALGESLLQAAHQEFYPHATTISGPADG
jgi:lipoate-protein ligase B